MVWRIILKRVLKLWTEFVMPLPQKIRLNFFVVYSRAEKMSMQDVSRAVKPANLATSPSAKMNGLLAFAVSQV